MIIIDLRISNEHPLVIRAIVIEEVDWVVFVVTTTDFSCSCSGLHFIGSGRIVEISEINLSPYFFFYYLFMIKSELESR